MEKYVERAKAHGIKENPVILAIESSCDETACAVLEGRSNLLSSEIESSMTEHIRFGGVVPEIASRAHTTAISIHYTMVQSLQRAKRIKTSFQLLCRWRRKIVRICIEKKRNILRAIKKIRASVLVQ